MNSSEMSMGFPLATEMFVRYEARNSCNVRKGFFLRGCLEGTSQDVIESREGHGCLTPSQTRVYKKSVFKGGRMGPLTGHSGSAAFNFSLKLLVLTDAFSLNAHRHGFLPVPRPVVSWLLGFPERRVRSLLTSSVSRNRVRMSDQS